MKGHPAVIYKELEHSYKTLMKSLNFCSYKNLTKSLRFIFNIFGEGWMGWGLQVYMGYSQTNLIADVR